MGKAERVWLLIAGFAFHSPPLYQIRFGRPLYTRLYQEPRRGVACYAPTNGVFIRDLVYLLQSPQANPRPGRVQEDQQQAAQYPGASRAITV
jgi:hypothetical protein